MKQRFPILRMVCFGLLAAGLIGLHSFFSKGGALSLHMLSPMYTPWLQKKGVNRADLYLEWDKIEGRPWVVLAKNVEWTGGRAQQIRGRLGWNGSGMALKHVDIHGVDVDLGAMAKQPSTDGTLQGLLSILLDIQGRIKGLALRGVRGLMPVFKTQPETVGNNTIQAPVQTHVQAPVQMNANNPTTDALLPKIDVYWDHGVVDMALSKYPRKPWARAELQKTTSGGNWHFSWDPTEFHVESLGMQHLVCGGSGSGMWTQHNGVPTDWSACVDVRQRGTARIPGVILDSTGWAGSVQGVTCQKPGKKNHDPDHRTKGCALSGAYIQGKFSKHKGQKIHFKMRLDGADLSGNWQAQRSDPKHAWIFSMHMDQGQIALSQLHHLWPRLETALGARNWVLQRFHGGSVSKGHISLHSPKKHTGVSQIQVQGGFSMQDTALSFMPDMPAIQNMQIAAVCDNRGFRISVKKGEFEKHAVTGKVTIQLDATPVMLQLETDLKGPVDTLLPMLLRLSNVTDLHIRRPTGQATTHIDGHMPLIPQLRIQDVTLNLRSQMPDAGFDFPIGPYWLDLRKNNIILEYKDKKIEIQAKGMANNMPIKWSLKNNVLCFSGQPSSQQLGDIFGKSWSRHVQKDPLVQGTYSNGVLDMSMDLMPCVCDLPWLAWKKPAGSGLCAVFKKTNQQMVLRLDGSGLKGRILADHGQMYPRIRADLHLGKTWCAYQYTGKKHAQDPIELWDMFLKSGHHQLFFRSPFVNMADLLQQVGATKTDQKRHAGRRVVIPAAASDQGVVIDLDLACDKLRMHHVEMEQVKVQLSGGAESLFPVEKSVLNHYVWRQGTFYSMHRAQKVKRQKTGHVSMSWDAVGQNKTRVIADVVDLGAAANGIGITQRIRGGNLRLQAIQDAQGVYTGSIYIDQMKTKFGALGKLLSIISPTMFTEMFSSGVMFEQVDAGFRYEPGLLKIINGVGKGVNLGLFLKGSIYTQPGSFKLQGVAVPSYLINTFFSQFPIIGWFFGGKKGLISSEFTVTGPLTNPKVNVVPLSLFKFGFLKSIPFFKEIKKAMKKKKKEAQEKAGKNLQSKDMLPTGNTGKQDGDKK